MVVKYKFIHLDIPYSHYIMNRDFPIHNSARYHHWLATPNMLGSGE